MSGEEARCANCGGASIGPGWGPCSCGGSWDLPPRTWELDVASLGRLGVWRYAAMLPDLPASDRVTLDEGGTPLHACPRLGAAYGVDALFLKNEGTNPTGSFKDRGMTVAVSLARRLGHRTIVCASTGNTAASAAAYANRAGLECVVLLPRGKVAPGKLQQARMFGARLKEIEGSFDAALERLPSEAEGAYVVNSLNPYRLEGQKTLAYEVWEQLGRRAPAQLWLPVGNAGNISSIWKGLGELAAAGAIEAIPRLVGVQAERAAPLVDAWKNGRKQRPHLADPRTVASAINIGRPASWDKALRAVRSTGGDLRAVSDAQILAAQNDLARLEGIWVEPASAAPLAALKEQARHEPPKGPIVVVGTGSGLKDPSILERGGDPPC